MSRGSLKQSYVINLTLFMQFVREKCVYLHIALMKLFFSPLFYLRFTFLLRENVN